MVGCIITGHGGFAPGLKAAYEMIGGDAEDFVAVPFTNENTAEYPDELVAAIDDLLARDGEVVVFCDLMGGQPCQQAMLAQVSRPGVEVVCGANLPMLLECLMSRDGTAAELADLAQEIGRMGVAHVERLEADAASADADAAFADEGDGI